MDNEFINESSQTTTFSAPSFWDELSSRFRNRCVTQSHQILGSPQVDHIQPRWGNGTDVSGHNEAIEEILRI